MQAAIADKRIRTPLSFKDIFCLTFAVLIVAFHSLPFKIIGLIPCIVIIQITVSHGQMICLGSSFTGSIFLA